MSRITENKNLFILLSGNVLAQLIPLAFSPVLSRIYTPGEFGDLALLMNLVNPLTVLACLKYDAAIVIPKENSSARDLLRISLRIAVIASIITWILAESTIFLSGSGSYPARHAGVLRMVAPTMLFAGITTAINYWLQRENLFRAIALFKLVQMCGITFFSIAWIYVFAGNGLTVGYMLGWAMVTLVIVYYLLVKHRFSLKKENRDQPYLKTYVRFPLFTGIPEFLNTLALSIPVFIFFREFGNDEAGRLNLCRQVLYFPASFIAVALSQYYYQEFSVHFRERKKLLPVTRKIMMITLPIAALMLLVVLLSGPTLFSFVFGQKWLVSGYYAQLMVALFSIQLCAIPLQSMFMAINKNYLFGLFRTLSFVVNLVLLYFHYDDPSQFLYLYVLCECSIWIASALCSFYFAYAHDRKLKQA